MTDLIHLNVVYNQQIQIALLIFIGFFSVKLKLLTSEAVDALAAYLLKIATPCMMLYRLPLVATRDKLLSAIPVFLFSFAVYGLLHGIGYCSGRLCRYSGDTLRIHTVHMGIGNLAAIGFPLIAAVLGDESGVYLAVIFLVDQIFLNLVAYPLSFPGQMNFKAGVASFKRIINPMMVALAIALGMILCGLQFPPEHIVGVTLNGITASCQPVAMIFVGGILGGIRLTQTAGLIGSAVLVLLRMILAPILIFWCSGLLPIPLLAREVIALNVSLPPLMSMAIMTKANGSDCSYAATSVCITTFCFLGTLPLVVQAIQLLS